MRKLFLFLSSIIFLGFYITEDVPGGSFDDIDIDEATPPATSVPAPADPVPPQVKVEGSEITTEEVKALKVKVEEQDKYIQEQINQKVVGEAVSEIKTRHSDFDEKQVYEYLKELNSKDPGKAAALNNPVGWENIWYQIRPVDVHNDRFHIGRNVAPVDRNDEVFGLVKSGSATLADEADVVGKLL